MHFRGRSCYFPVLIVFQKIFSFISSYLIDVALEVAVLEQSCDNVLLEGRYRAGIKSEALVEIAYEPLRQDHISDTQ